MIHVIGLAYRAVDSVVGCRSGMCGNRRTCSRSSANSRVGSKKTGARLGPTFQQPCRFWRPSCISTSTTTHPASNMCGIFCCYNHQGDLAQFRPRAIALSKLQRHRGPDWSGCYVGDDTVLVHERLAIVGVGECGRRGWWRGKSVRLCREESQVEGRKARAGSGKRLGQ
jgi:hypothetical protein